MNKPNVFKYWSIQCFSKTNDIHICIQIYFEENVLGTLGIINSSLDGDLVDIYTKVLLTFISRIHSRIFLNLRQILQFSFPRVKTSISRPNSNWQRTTSRSWIPWDKRPLQKIGTISKFTSLNLFQRSKSKLFKLDPFQIPDCPCEIRSSCVKRTWECTEGLLKQDYISRLDWGHPNFNLLHFQFSNRGCS